MLQLLLVSKVVRPPSTLLRGLANERVAGLGTLSWTTGKRFRRQKAFALLDAMGHPRASNAGRSFETLHHAVLFCQRDEGRAVTAFGSEEERGAARVEAVYERNEVTAQLCTVLLRWGSWVHGPGDLDVDCPLELAVAALAARSEANHTACVLLTAHMRNFLFR